MHQMPVGGGAAGLVFAAGSALIFLLAIPALWYLVGAAAVVGIIIAVLLPIVHRNHPDETEQLALKL